MKPISEMSLAEVAAWVWTHLEKNGIHCVLTGGACVSIYSSNTDQSLDIDFVENISSSRRQIRNALKAIGFEEEHRYFKHKETKFFIEFPAGPLSIGHEPVKDILTIQLSTGSLVLLSPTECIKDRLAAFYHWNDLQCLEQAFLVASQNTFDLKEVERWSLAENKISEFKIFRKRLFPRS